MTKPKFDNDIVIESVRSLIDRLEINFDATYKDSKLGDKKLFIDSYNKIMSHKVFSDKVNDNILREGYKEMSIIYRIIYGKFDIFKPMDGCFSGDTWRSVVTNSYIKSGGKKDDKEDEKVFIKTFADKFRDLFSQYIKSKEVEWGLVVANDNAAGAAVEQDSPRKSKRKKVEEVGVAAVAVDEVEGGAAGAAVNDNIPSASPSCASARLIAKGKNPATAKQ